MIELEVNNTMLMILVVFSNVFLFYLKESPEGKKMLDFRKSLPAFKENERLLQAIAQNQVQLQNP